MRHFSSPPDFDAPSSLLCSVVSSVRIVFLVCFVLSLGVKHAKVPNRYKFGSKKKRIPRRKQPSSSVDLMADYTDGTEETAGNDDDDGSERVSDSDRVRVDTVILSATEQSARQEAEEKLTELSTMFLTELKVVKFADCDSPDAMSTSISTFFATVDLDAVNLLLHSVKCISCGDGIRLEMAYAIMELP